MKRAPRARQPLVELFEVFRTAVGTGDDAALARLWARDAAPALEIFQHNSARVRAQGWTLALSQIAEDGVVATMTFEVREASGALVGTGELTATEEPEGWRIRGL